MSNTKLYGKTFQFIDNIRYQLSYRGYNLNIKMAQVQALLITV